MKNIVLLIAIFIIGCSNTNNNSLHEAQTTGLEQRITSMLEKSVPKHALAPKKKDDINFLLYNPEGQTKTIRVIGANGSYCAAVAIASQLAVTALHCVRSICAGVKEIGCQIHYEDANNIENNATVVSISESDLVALLDIHKIQPYGSLSCDDPSEHEVVYTVGHPDGEKWKTSYGHVVHNPINLEWVKGESTKVIVAEIPTKRGSSGGGLFALDNSVIGVQVARWSPWTSDYGKAAFIQANRVYTLVGNYCKTKGSNACVGLRCKTNYYDVWGYEKEPY